MNESFEQLLASDRKRYEKDCSICGEHIIYFHKSKEFGKPKVCPNCGDVYWDKPLIEVELFKLQDKYLAESDSKKKMNIMTDMYLKIYEYTERMIKSIMKSKKILSKDDLHTKTHDASAIILQRFLENPSYAMRSSFGGNIKKVLKGVLFGGRRNDEVLSLDYSKNGESNFGEFVSDDDVYPPAEEAFEENHLEQPNMCEDNGLTDDIVKIVEEFSHEIRKNDQAGGLLFLAGVYSTFLKKNKQSMSLFYQFSGSEIKQSVDYFHVYLRNYLKGSLGAADAC